MSIKGIQFHSIINDIFGKVNNYLQSEQISVNCPRCQEYEGLSKPDGKFNLEINTENGMFHCWKCSDPGFSGTLGKLIKTYGSDNDYEMYKSLGGNDFNYNYEEIDEDDIPVIINLPDEMILFSDMDIKNKDHLEAYNYMVIDRQITKDILFKYRIGFCVTGIYAKRIIIPSYNEFGDINYFVGRNYNPKVPNKFKYKNPEVDKNRIIFNEGFINWDSCVYLVEGGFEMVTFPVNIIPMLGKTIYKKLFFKLQEMKPNVVILLDPDAYKNAIEIFFKLKSIYIDCEEKVNIVVLPTEEDLDELRKNKGHDEVIKALYSARKLNTDDYFNNKLSKPYEKKRYSRYSNDTKYSKW
jgi:hypothetical protein